MKTIALILIRFYTLCISPLTGPSCRYQPTCSRYAIEAIEQHGAIKGAWLVCRRVLSCHPLSRRKFHDPVPEKTQTPFAFARLFGYKRNITKKEE